MTRLGAVIWIKQKGKHAFDTKYIRCPPELTNAQVAAELQQSVGEEPVLVTLGADSCWFLVKYTYTE